MNADNHSPVESSKIYIVIPVFNRKEITINCLTHLSNQTYSDFCVVVVDDGSTDGTEKEIRKLFPDTQIVKGTGKWWWTKSVNEGCKFAIERNARAVILMNDDTFFEDDYLQKMVDSTEKYPDSIIGSLSITMEKPHKIFFSGVKKIKRLTAKTIKYHNQFELYNKEVVKGMQPSEVLPGRGVYIPVNVFKKIGYLNEKYLPQYFADFDFVNRAKRNGISVFINWDLIIYSYWQETGKGALYVKQKFSDFLKAFFNKYSHRSIKAVFHYFKAFCPWYILPFTITIHHLRVFYSYFIKSKITI